MKAIITVGISASGKTTWAKTQGHMLDINRDYIRFNHILPGSNWSTYKFTKAREKAVSEFQLAKINHAADFGLDVIISDTNLNPVHRARLIATLTDLGFTVEIKEFPISLEEAWRRDSIRENGVGHSVIYSQHQKWLEYIGAQKYVPDSALPKAIIFDIDGTLAEMNGRGPFDWHRVGEDSQRELIVQMAIMYSKTHNIIVVSGRDGSCQEATYNWLREAGIPVDGFFMREAGDMRKDTIIKSEIFWANIAPYYDVQAVVDDRPSVVRMWYDIGIKNVICVGNPWAEF